MNIVEKTACAESVKICHGTHRLAQSVRLVCVGTNRQTEFRSSSMFLMRQNHRMVKQSNGHEPANGNVRENPKSGPWDRRGSRPGVTGLKYRVDRLESKSGTSVGRCRESRYKH